MGRRKPKGGGGGGDGRHGPTSAESALEAAEEAIESGEKQLRLREPKKSRARFVEALDTVRTASLAESGTRQQLHQCTKCCLVVRA